MRSRIRRTVDAALTALWGGGCAVAGRLRSPVPRWRSEGGRRVLVLAPHPDDELACAAAIVLHRRARDEVVIVHVTDGRRSRAGGLDPETMAGRRRLEARASVETLGVDRGEWLGLPEGDWADDQLSDCLTKLVSELAPDSIYAPSRVDFHPEHHRVARVLARVLDAVTLDCQVRVYQVQVPLTRVLVNLVVPAEPAIPVMLRAWACYSTQEGSLRALWRLSRYAARSHGIQGLAQEFWVMTPQAYAAMHAESPSRPPQDIFRGLRRIGWTDPLAFLRGRRERRRLRHLASRAGR